MTVVLVTGATGGIGSAVVLAYAERGAHLVLLARSSDALGALAAEVVATGAPEPLVARADVADAAAVDAAMASARARFGRLDVVVHSAAVITYGRLTEVPPDVWDRTVGVGVLGTANVARAALQAFERQASFRDGDRDGDRNGDGPDGGHLVVIGSVLGRVTAPFMGAYVTAKFAVRGLVRVLQQEARSTPGVHVTLVEPGAVATPMYRLAGNYAGRIGRPPPPVAQPDAVARAVLDAVDRRQGIASVGLANPLMRLGFAVTPWLYDRLVTPLVRVAGLGDEVAAHPGNVFTPSEEVPVRAARRRAPASP